MLINSTHKNEKIVLGLLSYTYPEGAPSVEEMKNLIEEYREQDDKFLLLYKDLDTDNFVGLLAIEKIVDKENENNLDQSMTINIERIGVIPSFSSKDIGFKMFKALKEKCPEATIIGSMGNVELITTWTKQYNALND